MRDPGESDSTRRLAASALFGLAFAIAGCTQQNVREADSLPAGEGILVATADCKGAIDWMEFYESGKLSTGFSSGFHRAGVIACGKGVGRKSMLRTIRVKQGRYFIGSVGSVSVLKIPEAQALAFTIEAGKLNYIGDLHAPLMDFQANTSYIDILVYNNGPAARQALELEYPALALKYPWVERLAEDPRH